MQIIQKSGGNILIELEFGKNVKKRFKTSEEQANYITFERKVCAKQLIEYFKAISKEDREEAYNALCRARLRAYQQWIEIPNEAKDIA
jgi:hypothetical protein